MKSPEEFERNGDFRGEVSSEWLLKGAWLSGAWKKYGGPPAVKAFDAEKAFAKLRDGETPEAYAAFQCSTLERISRISRSSLNEYIWSTPPLPPKAHYPEIGKSFELSQRTPWLLYGSFRYLAETTVYALLLGGLLRAYGSKGNTASDPTWIPVRAWLDLKKDRSAIDKVFASGVIYFNVHIIDPNNDHLQSSKEQTSFRTGTAGRDTSIQLAEIALRERAASDEMIKAPFSGEAKILAELVRKQYPTAPPLTAKTIQNQLGPLWRELGGGKTIPKKNISG